MNFQNEGLMYNGIVYILRLKKWIIKKYKRCECYVYYKDKLRCKKRGIVRKVGNQEVIMCNEHFQKHKMICSGYHLENEYNREVRFEPEKNILKKVDKEVIQCIEHQMRIYYAEKFKLKTDFGHQTRLEILKKEYSKYIYIDKDNKIQDVLTEWKVTYDKEKYEQSKKEEEEKSKYKIFQ